MMGDFYFSEIGGAWTETDDFFLLQFYQTLRNGNGGGFPYIGCGISIIISELLQRRLASGKK